MEIEKNKLFAKKNLFRSIILFIVCTPLLLGAILKLFYYLPPSENILSNGVASGLKDLVSKIYHGFEPAQWIWPISPTPNVEVIFTTGNIISILLLLGFLWAIASFQVGVATIDGLSQAKRNARKKRLEDEY